MPLLPDDRADAGEDGYCCLVVSLGAFVFVAALVVAAACGWLEG